MEGKVNKNSYWINMLKLYIWDVIKNCCLHQFLWSSCFYLGRVFSRQKQKMTNPSLPSAMAGAWQGSGPKSRVFPFDDSKTQSSADPKPSSCNVSCFRKKKRQNAICIPLCKGGGCVFVGRLLRVHFLLNKYEISNDSSFGLHHKRWLPKNINPWNRINLSGTTDFLQYHKKKQHLGAVFWGPGDSSPALVALQDYFASPPVYWSFLAAKIANKKALPEETKNL